MERTSLTLAYGLAITLILLMLVVGFAMPAKAAVLYANDFNSCAFDSTWATVWLDKNRIFHQSNEKRGTSGCAVQLHYPATADAMTRGEGAATDRHFPDTYHINVRYWIKLSDGFQTSNISTKWLYGPRSEDAQLYKGGPAGAGCLLVTQGGPVPYLGCQGTALREPESFIAVPYNYGGGYANGPAQRLGEWACYEYEIDLGDIGQANGLMRLWKNDQLIGEVTGQLMRPTSAVGHFNNIAFYQERGIGDIWIDDLVITDGTRIGCGTSAPSTPPPPIGGAGGTTPPPTAPPPASPPPTTPPPPPVVAPGAIDALVVTKIGQTSFDVDVQGPADTSGKTLSVDLRVSEGVMSWGMAVQYPCALPKCTLVGLKPNTSYQLQGIYYYGTLDKDAVFGPFSRVQSVVTLPADPAPEPEPTIENKVATIQAQLAEAQKELVQLRLEITALKGKLELLRQQACAMGGKEQSFPAKVAKALGGCK